MTTKLTIAERRSGNRSIFSFARRAKARAKSTENGSAPAGFTLLEIILALAILAGSLVALGEVMRLGDQKANDARDETEAEILASGVMDELLCGFREPVAVNQQSFVQPYQSETASIDSSWVYSVLIEETNYSEVLRVGVRVEQLVDGKVIDERKEPVHFEFYRWVLNPEFVQAIADEEAQIAADAQAKADAAASAAAANGGAAGGGGTGTGGGGTGSTGSGSGTSRSGNGGTTGRGTGGGGGTGRGATGGGAGGGGGATSRGGGGTGGGGGGAGGGGGGGGGGGARGGGS